MWKDEKDPDNKPYKIHKNMREDDDGVTTGRRGHSRRSYLEKPWHRCWWQTWSWGWGCCCPRGTSPASPHSGVPGSLRCNGTSSGTESEPHRCRDGTDGWRTKCRCTLFPRSSLWLCGLEGTCVNMRQSYKAQTLEKLSDKMKHWLLQSYETYTDSVKINPSGVTPQIPRYALWRLQCRLWSTLKKRRRRRERKKPHSFCMYVLQSQNMDIQTQWNVLCWFGVLKSQPGHLVVLPSLKEQPWHSQSLLLYTILSGWHTIRHTVQQGAELSQAAIWWTLWFQVQCRKLWWGCMFIIRCTHSICSATNISSVLITGWLIFLSTWVCACGCRPLIRTSLGMPYMHFCELLLINTDGCFLCFNNPSALIKRFYNNPSINTWI